jgi:hypothetical protein
MMITKTCLSRRTVLRGLGAGIALPLLDGMVPAFAAMRNSAANPVRRLGVVYVGNGKVMDHWTPAADGTAFEFTPILEPLRPFRDHVTIVSGLNLEIANQLPGEGSGDHARAPAAFLTGVHPKKTEGVDIRGGISMDQIAAQQLGSQTQLASLELSLETNEIVGACDIGYSCAYQSTISWRTATTPLPMENDPRAVFERLFGGDTTDARERLIRIRRERSLLDSVTASVARLRNRLGPGDQRKLAEYLDAIRDVERRIQTAEQQSALELPLVEQPAGTPGSYEDYARLMFDLQVLAFQCDLTRVFTFLMVREASDRTYPQVGVPDAHHPISHHGGDAGKLAKYAKVNAHHVGLFAYFVDRLRSTADGDGSLLDHAMILYGSGISDGDLHSHVDVPVVLVGRGGGQVKGGRHIRYPRHTPLANLHVALLEKAGVPLEKLGDSTGPLQFEPLTGV